MRFRKQMVMIKRIFAEDYEFNYRYLKHLSPQNREVNKDFFEGVL